MSLFKSFWIYWKWVCTALVTSCIVLGALTLLLGGFDVPKPGRELRECIENGGTWVQDEGLCKAPA